MTLFQCTILPRRVEGIYNFTRNIYKLNNVHKSNRQRHIFTGGNWHVFYSINSLMFFFLMSPIQMQNKLIKFILEDSVICWNNEEHSRNTVTIPLTSVHGRHVHDCFSYWSYTITLIWTNMNKENDKYKVYYYTSNFFIPGETCSMIFIYYNQEVILPSFNNETSRDY